MHTCIYVAASIQERRINAEAQLKAARDRDFKSFCELIVQELADGEKDVSARQVAGLLLKNSLSARDAAMDTSRREKYLALPDNTKADVKRKYLSRLNTIFPL